jgi:2-amino-1-hydroxyethylphosphonate dioxygenase (glycine-forming)
VAYFGGIVVSASAVANEIRELFEKGGSEAYFGERVTQLQHALQAAHRAAEAGADGEMVVASLLHDIGHLLGGNLHAEIGVIDHDRSCIEWLQARGFSPRLVALVSGHVRAKRYLVATRPDYRAKLSEASTKTLALQGGPMNADEVREFEEDPYFREMLRLRAWDELAKDPEAVVPGLEHYVDQITAAASGVRTRRIA